MALLTLSLSEFRNLQNTELHFSPSFNLIRGDNGSGKTSLLEAINIVCQGRSLRSKSLESCIRHGTSQFTAFGKFSSHSVGVARNSEKTLLRLNGDNVNRVSSVVERAPVTLITSDVSELIVGGPGIRREFIDWCLFHVEHSYKNVWRDYSRALKQKNQLLKNHAPTDELMHWNRFLAKSCLSLYHYRRQCLEDINRQLKAVDIGGYGSHEIEVTYRPGWKTLDDPLVDLENNLTRERRYRFSVIGSHRDRIEIFADGKRAIEVLSRGQMKKLAVALKLAQSNLVHKKGRFPVIALVDDLSAELDDYAINRILEVLMATTSQLFITTINPLIVKMNYPQDSKMFHVEHGIITPA